MKSLTIITLFILIGHSVSGQSEYPVTYSITGEIRAMPSAIFEVPVSFVVEKPWYIYAPTSNNATGGLIETNVIFQLPKEIKRKGKIQFPKAHYKDGHEVFEGNNIRYVQQFSIIENTPPGEYIIRAKIIYQSCNASMCLPPKTDEVEIKVTVKAESPNLKFTALDGRKVDFEELKGKVILIDCWATWCRPCIAEFDNLKKLYGKYHDKGFEVIGISMDEESAKQRVKDLVVKHKLPWPQSFEGKGFDENSFVKQHGIASLPAVFLIDQEGNIVDNDARGEKLEGLILKYRK